MSDDETRAESAPMNSAAYPDRLKEKTLLVANADDEADPEADRPDIDALRTLVERADGSGTAFQSVAIAAVQILEHALCYEREAAEAALSLGQQEKMQAMVKTAEEAVHVLRDTLDAQGDKAARLCTSDEPVLPSDGQPWWFALTDALEVLEEGTSRMSSLTTAQPADSPAHQLSALVTRLLRGHHDALLIEADEWIS